MNCGRQSKRSEYLQRFHVVDVVVAASGPVSSSTTSRDRPHDETGRNRFVCTTLSSDILTNNAIIDFIFYVTVTVVRLGLYAALYQSLEVFRLVQSQFPGFRQINGIISSQLSAADMRKRLFLGARMYLLERCRQDMHVIAHLASARVSQVAATNQNVPIARRA